MEAFRHVQRCRVVVAMVGVLGFDWPAVATRLGVRGMWDIEIEDGLSICEETMRSVEATEKKAEGEGSDD